MGKGGCVHVALVAPTKVKDACSKLAKGNAALKRPSGVPNSAKPEWLCAACGTICWEGDLKHLSGAHCLGFKIASTAALQCFSCDMEIKGESGKKQSKIEQCRFAVEEAVGRAAGVAGRGSDSDSDEEEDDDDDSGRSKKSKKDKKGKKGKKDKDKKDKKDDWENEFSATNDDGDDGDQLASALAAVHLRSGGGWGGIGDGDDEVDEPPVVVRSPPRGLVNLGNTCFFNSVLQCLVRVPGLLETMSGSQPDGASPKPSAPVLSADGRLGLALRSTLKELRAGGSGSGSVNPSELLAEVGRVNASFKGRQQQDSHELLRALLDGIREESRRLVVIDRVKEWDAAATGQWAASLRGVERPDDLVAALAAGGVDGSLLCTWLSSWDLKETKRSAKTRLLEPVKHEGDRKALARGFLDLERAHVPWASRLRTSVDRVFGGQLQSAVRCHTCGHLSVTKESFLDLSLPISPPESVSLLDVLRASQRSRRDKKESKHARKPSPKRGKKNKGKKGRKKGGGDDDDDNDDDEKASPSNNRAKKEAEEAGQAGAGAAAAPHPLQGPCNVEDCLGAFTAVEELSGPDAYRCDRCASRQPATKQVLISRPPRVLTLHLKRFTAGLSKLSKHVDFGRLLDLSPFAVDGCGARYRLVGFVVHSGGLHGGHFVAVTQLDAGRWRHYSDTHTSDVSLQKVPHEQAYLLFYERLSGGSPDEDLEDPAPEEKEQEEEDEEGEEVEEDDEGDEEGEGDDPARTTGAGTDAEIQAGTPLVGAGGEIGSGGGGGVGVASVVPTSGPEPPRCVEPASSGPEHEPDRDTTAAAGAPGAHVLPEGAEVAPPAAEADLADRLSDLPEQPAISAAACD